MGARCLVSLVGVSVAIGLAGCGSSSSSATGDVKSAHNKTLKTDILVDSRGRTLYMFAQDTRGETPTCVDDPAYHCSKVWPPLLAKHDVKAGEGVNASLLKTIRRKEGTMQVTYNGYALYTFNGYETTPADTKPGNVNGQNFFSIWFVLSPVGKPIRPF